jgi:hypothetical protein
MLYKHNKTCYTLVDFINNHTISCCCSQLGPWVTLDLDENIVENLAFHNPLFSHPLSIIVRAYQDTTLHIVLIVIVVTFLVIPLMNILLYSLIWDPGSALFKYCKYTCACTKGVLFRTSMYKMYVIKDILLLSMK